MARDVRGDHGELPPVVPAGDVLSGEYCTKAWMVVIGTHSHPYPQPQGRTGKERSFHAQTQYLTEPWHVPNAMLLCRYCIVVVM